MTGIGIYIAEVRREARLLGYPLADDIGYCGRIFDGYDFGTPAKKVAAKYMADYERVVLGK